MNTIPQPKETLLQENEYLSVSRFALNVDEAFGEDLPFVCSFLRDHFCLNAECAQQDVNLRITLNTALGEEAYGLTVDRTGILIEASAGAGQLYALQTLRQEAIIRDGTVRIPFMRIKDAPAYGWRGMLMDVARHFFPKEELLLLIDLLSFYKFNKLHLHLCDDQGFRMESLRYPQLNTVGSWRTESQIAFGLGNRCDGKPHGGYYTQAELREIVAYARKRNIKIIPELELPGHMLSVIASFPELSCEKKPLPVRTCFGIEKTILCAGEEKVYEIITDILDEMISIFPGPFIHLGGDEAPKDHWKKCPKCQEKMKQEGLRDEQALQVYMVNRFAAYLREKGKKVITWNEALGDDLQEDILCQYWTPGEGKALRKTIAAANKGRKVIFSNFLRLYLDYPYAMTPLEKTYSFSPDFKGFTPQGKKCIQGIECALWTEWVEDREKLWFNLLPRLAAVSEAAWTGEGRDYRAFTGKLPAHYVFYEKMGLPYAKDMERSPSFLKRMHVMRYWSKNPNIEVQRK